jgi:hypothetical protein
MFSVGDRVEYRYDPDIPNGWRYLHGWKGTVHDSDNCEGLIYVKFDYKPHLGALPCEPSEITKIKESSIAV